MLLLQNAEFWVAVGVVLFFVLLAFLKVPTMATKSLDDRALKIRTSLDEADRLRAEALHLLDSLKAQRAEVEAQAAQMLQDAHAEAQRLEADAKVKLEEQIVRRTALADRRIAQAEQQAATDVKAAAADLAAHIAETLLRGRLEGMTSDPLVDRAVEQLGARLQ
ncbi:ATP F0F1 synthase subunit B [Caulobacter sp. S45]|uniref:F0F1 ATP synthase subunit B family protein n=1 Tax=Caulobacter sp. S45 TaxID=1641861 RepID=UPI00131B9F48|nr:ATP F0F1 synthase subunit B [Caulobacter sp. S45]